MIVIHVMGGLGNQLYQYAMYRKMQTLGKDVKLDTFAYKEAEGDEREWRELELEWLQDLPYKVCSMEERAALLDNKLDFFHKIKRKLCGRKDLTVRETTSYMPEIFDYDYAYLYGYWTCEKYYEDIIPLLQKEIIFPKSVNKKNLQAMEMIKNMNAISIHIRRQDYLTVSDGKRYMGICTDAYYEAAINYIKRNVETPVFIFFSDDIPYVREHYHLEHMMIVDWNSGRDSLYDMQLMSLCKHNICANSTFSMWGARLNTNSHKIVIRPLHDDNYDTTPVEKIQEYWKHWILIDEKGKVLS